MEIRRAHKKDADAFAELVLMAAPYFPELFGQSIKETLKILFCEKENLFSYQHTYTAEENGEISGIILGYDQRHKDKEDLKTGVLLLKHFKKTLLIKKIFVLLDFNRKIGKLKDMEYYISDVAVYPSFQGQGIGKKLLQTAFNEAKERKNDTVVLDVEKNNYKAINIYKRLWFIITNDFSVKLSKNTSLSFYRMKKDISKNS